MRTNTKVRTKVRTHEGAPATSLTAARELEKTVLTCLLFEKTFYEKGCDIAERIKTLCKKVSPEIVARIADKARNEMYLRSVSLFLARELARNAQGPIVSETIDKVIQRADELSEFLSLYWLDGRQPLSAQVKKGLAKAFTKFNSFQLAKYDRNNVNITLRDVLFLCHAKPLNKKQEGDWKALIDGTLPIPNTWETRLSAGENKGEVFESLLRENALGYFALLRNLRNMEESGCNKKLICDALLNIESYKRSKVLPFRFATAYRNVGSTTIRKAINEAFVEAAKTLPVLNGVTILLVDVSGSMDAHISDKSEVSRIDVAASLGAVLKETSRVITYTFSENLKKVSSTRHGMEFIEDVNRSQPHSSTYLGRALNALKDDPCDRIIVITDEQSHDVIPNCWAEHGYIVNVAPYKPSIAYKGGWELISGWSDKIVNYISLMEEFGK